ncbi:MAG: translation initiation factor IF-2 subunit beta [Promethearchaeota archaeon]
MDDDEYIALLNHAIDELPEEAMHRDRFEIPESIILSEGNKTFIKNFRWIADKLKRYPKHLLKYLSNEIGTATNFEEQSGRAIFQGTFSKKTIYEAIESYVKEFVICPTCNKPDTVIEKQNRQFILVCHACGARHSVRRI